ncbi:MAG TPA: hypothetical protein VL754_08075 [Verrucomicrobiae bacterium]|nr:hypothetical protein [Verrucomicrobiae bacterium]
MKPSVTYRDYLIQSESFQRRKDGPWVAQYVWKRFEAGGKAEASSFPTDQYQFHVAFTTEIEADEYALSRAKEWIDGR